MHTLRTRRTVTKGLAVASIALVVPAIAVAATPDSGSWVGKATKGSVVKGAAGKPTFKVSGNKLKKFTIRGAGAFCFSGYSVVTVYVPSVAIHNGHFSRTYHPIKSANVKLTGHFTSASRAVGTVTGSGYACDYSIKWVAHRR